MKPMRRSALTIAGLLTSAMTAASADPAASAPGLTVAGTPTTVTAPAATRPTRVPAGYALSVIDGSLMPLSTAGPASAPTGLTTAGLPVSSASPPSPVVRTTRTVTVAGEPIPKALAAGTTTSATSTVVAP